MQRTMLAAAVAAVTVAAGFAQAPATTVFEGARVIVGDGRPAIENATIVMNGDRFTLVGSGAAVRVAASAIHVSLAGKTVMPAIVDTHVHTSTTPPELSDDLKRRAYFGVGAVLSLGLDGTEAPFEQRAKTTPGLARFYLAGRGITAPEKGRTDVPYWITSEDQARQAVQVIVAATRTAAEFVRVPNTGTIEAGRTADFIVLDANPLDDITNTRRIAAVYLRGSAVAR